MGKLLKEFMTISGKLLDGELIHYYPYPAFPGITEKALLKSLAHSHELNSIDLDDIHLPNLPRPQKAFRGIRKKSSSLKRWLAICSDDLTK
ncbi:unnamed protein product [Prunus armeniaca]|uniref:Uncharacterized protein n=1 Tax=Prunus armeniaca TaxID=36596 RepID=A0A6J5UJX8_PRUAR|nr:unnamed protein product [Prunus armeniaca]